MIGGKGYFRWGSQGGALSGRQRKPRIEELNYDKHDKSANRKEKCFHVEGPAQARGLPDVQTAQLIPEQQDQGGWRVVKKDHREGRGQITQHRGENFWILFQEHREASEGF